MFLSFGHKDGGKSYSVYGQNNYQLHKNLTDVRIEDSDDSRGLVLRVACHIMQKDPQAKLSISYFDIAMESIRDLLKYTKKDSKKGNAYSFFEE